MTVFEYWMLPACNFTGNLELSIGGSHTHDDSGTRTTDVVLQGKTLFKPLWPNGRRRGLDIGTVRRPQADAGGLDWYAYIPASFDFRPASGQAAVPGWRLSLAGA